MQIEETEENHLPLMREGKVFSFHDFKRESISLQLRSKFLSFVSKRVMEGLFYKDDFLDIHFQ